MPAKHPRAPWTWWLVLFPWVNFLRHRRFLQAFACFVIWSTVYLWPLAAIWARTAHPTSSSRPGRYDWLIDWIFHYDEPTSYPRRRH